MYRLEKTGDWGRVRREVGGIYKERMHLVGDDGSLTPVEQHEPEHEELPEKRHVMEQQANVETRKNGHTPTARQPAADSALSLLWDGLPPAITEKLTQPLDQGLVSSRKGRSGRSFAYLEGHAAIAQANRIFGYGGWGYELVGDVTYRELKSVDARHALSRAEGTGEVSTTGMYCATVRVTVPGVPPRTDVGCQAVAEDTPDGHDTAFKGAVTDALKRSLRSFGDQFGNALYGDGAEEVLLPALKDSLLQLGKAQGLSEPQMLDAVRKKTGKTLDALPAAEVVSLIQAMLRKQAVISSAAPRVSSTDGTTPLNGATPRQ